MGSSDSEKFVQAVNAAGARPGVRARRPFARLGHFSWRVFDGLRVHHAASAAPAMAFHFFLSLIPVLVLVGFALGLVVRQRGVDAILGPALETAPDVAEAIARKELERLAGASSAPIAPLSILGFMWLAATGTHGLMDVFESAVAAPPRPWWKQRAMALGWVAGALVVVAALGWTMIKADVVLRRYVGTASTATAASASASPPPVASSAPRPSPPPPTTKSHSHRRLLPPLLSETWERLGALAALSFFAVAGLAGFYRFAVEHPPGVRRRVWPGACVAFATWLVVSWSFGVYVSTLASYTLYYGGLAAVAVLIVWLYLTSWVLLIGVEVNAQLEGLRGEGGEAPPLAPRTRANDPERRARTSTS